MPKPVLPHPYEESNPDALIIEIGARKLRQFDDYTAARFLMVSAVNAALKRGSPEDVLGDLTQILRSGVSR